MFLCVIVILEFWNSEVVRYRLRWQIWQCIMRWGRNILGM